MRRSDRTNASFASFAFAAACANSLCAAASARLRRGRRREQERRRTGDRRRAKHEHPCSSPVPLPSKTRDDTEARTRRDSIRRPADDGGLLHLDRMSPSSACSRRCRRAGSGGAHHASHATRSTKPRRTKAVELRPNQIGNLRERLPRAATREHHDEAIHRAPLRLEHRPYRLTGRRERQALARCRRGQHDGAVQARALDGRGGDVACRWTGAWSRRGWGRVVSAGGSPATGPKATHGPVTAVHNSLIWLHLPTRRRSAAARRADRCAGTLRRSVVGSRQPRRGDGSPGRRARARRAPPLLARPRPV